MLTHKPTEVTNGMEPKACRHWAQVKWENRWDQELTSVSMPGYNWFSARMLSQFSCVQLFATNPMDCSPPGSSVHGILQARILEWVAMPCRGSAWPRDQTHISCTFPAQAGGFFTTSAAWEAHLFYRWVKLKFYHWEKLAKCVSISVQLPPLWELTRIKNLSYKN